MATPFQTAWTFLKAENYRGSEHRRRYDAESVDNKYDNEAHAWDDGTLPKVRGLTNEHRQRVEGGDVTTQDKSHLFIPEEKRKILQTFPSSDDAQDNYALDESLNDEEDEDYYEQDKDDTNVTPDSQEEMYNRFSQNPNNKGY